MITRDERIRRRHENAAALKDVDQTREEIIARKLDQIEKQYTGIKEQIKALQEEKARLLKRRAKTISPPDPKPNETYL